MNQTVSGALSGNLGIIPSKSAAHRAVLLASLSIHRVFLGVVCTNTRFLRNEANEFAFSIILLCHNSYNFTIETKKRQDFTPCQFLFGAK